MFERGGYSAKALERAQSELDGAQVRRREISKGRLLANKTERGLRTRRPRPPSIRGVAELWPALDVPIGGALGRSSGRLLETSRPPGAP